MGTGNQDLPSKDHRSNIRWSDSDRNALQIEMASGILVLMGNGNRRLLDAYIAGKVSCGGCQPLKGGRVDRWPAHQPQ